jgi:hypothetical protein
MRCLRCAEVFAAERISAKYCSNKCRQMAYLKRHAPPRPPGVGGPLTWADLEQIIWRPTPAVPD